MANRKPKPNRFDLLKREEEQREKEREIEKIAVKEDRQKNKNEPSNRYHQYTKMPFRDRKIIVIPTIDTNKKLTILLRI